MNRKLSDVLFFGVLILIAALGALQLPGCGGGSSSVGVLPADSTRLQVSLTDKASDDYATVMIAIKEIRVVPAGREDAPDGDSGLPIIATFDTPHVVDILTLKFQQDILGTAVVPPGSYNQVRLILEPNSTDPGVDPVNYLTLIDDPTVKIPLKTPSGVQSGLKVLGKFTVEAGILNAIMIDFDPNTAIVARGNGEYNLKPTGIRIIELSSPLYDDFGSLAGMVVSTFKDFSSASVSVVPEGGTIPAASGTVFSSYTSSRWEAPFTSFVPAGSYKVYVQAKGFDLYSTTLQLVEPNAETAVGELLLVPQP